MEGLVMDSHCRHRRLDFRELYESSLIADLVRQHADDEAGDPGTFELATSPVLDQWSVAPGPRLIGVDESGAVLALDVLSIAGDYTWAQTTEGVVRLRDQSRIPFKPEGGR
jgi:hypothetical protein